MIPATDGSYSVSFELRHKDGSVDWLDVEVVAFEDDGTPLMVDPNGSHFTGLRSPSDLSHAGKWVLVETPRHATTPAEPGWYALYTTRGVLEGDERDEQERLPVIAWRSTRDTYDGSATVIGYDDSGMSVPQDAVAHAREINNVTLVGFFHRERYPEPETP